MNKFRKLARMLSNPKYRAAWLLHALPAGLEHEPVLKLRDYKTIIDIGANKGQFTLVAKHCCPDARIMAFEPLRDAAERFRAFFMGDTQITLYQLAIGSVNRVSQMHVSARDHSSSLLPITRLQRTVFPGTEPVGTEEVRVERLDSVISSDLIESPALLKLDVQGYELEALKGCDRLLSAFDYIYVECSFIELYEKQALAHAVIAFLGEHQFQLQRIYNVYTYDGAAVQGDFLFGRASKTQEREKAGPL
jgi:FkbM family methyltransferase